jgi:hypothetical protein
LSPPVKLQERRGEYRVEGEVGRFGFTVYEACDASGEVIRRGDGWFPPRQPREWHKTEGFREEALCLEASRRSYRDNTAHWNRYRRQWEEGTPVTTLRDNAQKEGAQVLDVLERHSQRVLADHGFEPDGRAPEAVVDEITAGVDRRQKAEMVDEQLTAVVEEMGRRGFSPEQIESVRQRTASAIHEDPAHCTNVSVDDVSVKKQKAHRQRAATPGASPDGSAALVAPPAGSQVKSEAGKSSRPKVANTVARIEQGSKHFTLTASSLEQVLRFVLAFLLHNELLGGRLHLFSDGYRSLQDTLLAFFAWHPRVWLVLDWYHVVKKFKEDLSRACGAREIRNQHLRTLVRFLWYGMVTEARQYLDTIPTTEVKDRASIERLRNYLDRNERSIPCYALRRRLGLPNGSSPVESANNQVTARRQKRNGMSWSKVGSHALTALSMLVCNRCQQIWVCQHTVPLRFVDNKAA